MTEKNEAKQEPKQKPNEDTKKAMKKGKHTIPVQMARSLSQWRLTVSNQPSEFALDI